MVAFDRSLQTSFFIDSSVAPVLIRELFWFSATRGYVLAYPASESLELLPVFSRSRCGLSPRRRGMLGWRLASSSGSTTVRERINSALRRSTCFHGGDLAHTGHLPVRDGDLVEGEDPLPADAVLPGWFLQLFSAGSGLPLRHPQRRQHPHLLRHGALHYTIMGGLIFASSRRSTTGAKMTGLRFNERLAKIHFWTMFIAFNSTFGHSFGLMDSRRVATYARTARPQHLVSCPRSARRLHAASSHVLTPWSSRASGGVEPVALQVDGMQSRRPCHCTTSTASRSSTRSYDYGPPPRPAPGRRGIRSRLPEKNERDGRQPEGRSPSRRRFRSETCGWGSSMAG